MAASALCIAQVGGPPLVATCGVASQPMHGRHIANAAAHDAEQSFAACSDAVATAPRLRRTAMAAADARVGVQVRGARPGPPVSLAPSLHQPV